MVNRWCVETSTSIFTCHIITSNARCITTTYLPTTKHSLNATYSHHNINTIIIIVIVLNDNNTINSITRRYLEHGCWWYSKCRFNHTTSWFNSFNWSETWNTFTQHIIITLINNVPAIIVAFNKFGNVCCITAGVTTTEYRTRTIVGIAAKTFAWKVFEQ